MRLSIERARSLAGIIFGFGILCLTASNTYGQVDTGTILGAVRDQGGAVVPGAKVTLTNEGTGVSSTTLSRADGSYVFTPIRIGSYAVSTEVPGFETARQLHVEVNIQQQLVLDFL